MQLWQMDIVGGIRLVSPVTGEPREAKARAAVDARVIRRTTTQRVRSIKGQRLGGFRGARWPAVRLQAIILEHDCRQY
jgi:hypothetical protein